MPCTEIALGVEHPPPTRGRGRRGLKKLIVRLYRPIGDPSEKHGPLTPTATPYQGRLLRRKIERRIGEILGRSQACLLPLIVGHQVFVNKFRVPGLAVAVVVNGHNPSEHIGRPLRRREHGGGVDPERTYQRGNLSVMP